MRILLIYPGHSHSTIDVAVGYDQALRSLGHDVRTFNYHLRLGFYLKALEYWAGVNDDFTRRDGDFAVLASESVIIEAVDFVPDIVLIICGIALHRRAFELFDRLCLPKVLLLTESPYSDEDQIQIAKLGKVSATLTNDRASVKRLKKAIGGRVEYLPHSYNPGRHFARGRPDGKYASDVFFFGTMWPERQKLFDVLLKNPNGYKMNIGGVVPIRQGEVKGFMDNAELAWYYAGTKIALNHNRTVKGKGDRKPVHIKRREAWSLGPRAFEIAACQTFQLCDGKRPELKAIFGKTVPTYRSARDLRKKVNYYLKHDDERLQMAVASSERVADCTFKNRASDILVPLMMEVKNGT